MNFRNHKREELVISVTPMIDVVFLLLIFFMVTTTFNRETELKITLPEADGGSQAAERSIDIVIGRDGRYLVNEQEVINRQTETLMRALQSAAGKQENPLVVITADADARHQSVITALDALSQLGMVNITFATTKVPAKQDD